MGLSTTLTLRFQGNAVKAGLESIKKGFKDAAVVGGAFGAATVAAGLAGAAGLIAVSKQLYEIGEAGRTSDNRVKQIAESMGIFGDKSGEVSDRLNDLADTQGRLLGIDDDVIAATEAKLLTFKELAATAGTVGGAFDRATMAALDMAKAGFGEAEQNAVQLGKALNDPIGGIKSLTKSGITFTAAEREKIKVMVESGKTFQAQGLILKAIETQVGGVAAATAKGSERMAVTMSQLKESLAIPFSTAFDDLPNKLESISPRLAESAGKLGGVLGDSIARGIDGDASKLIAVGKLIADYIESGLIAGSVGLVGKGAVFNFDVLKSMGAGAFPSMAGTFAGANVNSLVPNAAEAWSAQLRLRGVNKQAEALQDPAGGMVPGTGGNWRYAGANEPTTFSAADGSAVVKVLQSIDRKLSPQP